MGQYWVSLQFASICIPINTTGLSRLVYKFSLSSSTTELAPSSFLKIATISRKIVLKNNILILVILLPYFGCAIVFKLLKLTRSLNFPKFTIV